MKKTSRELNSTHRVAWLLTVCTATLLSACGGGGGGGGGGSGGGGSIAPQVATPLATGVITLQLDIAAASANPAALQVQPAFRVAPVLLNEPDDTDAADNAASASMNPRTQIVPSEFRNLSTRRLTVQTLKAARRVQEMSLQGGVDGSVAAMADASVSPMAAGGVISTYSPAQIRAAYDLPPLTSIGAMSTAAQAAQLGAGQTIYIIDSMDDPNIATELAAFDKKFGLPACTIKAIPANAGLPLAASSSSSCELSVVHSTANGTMTGVAPAYDAGWATEIALDVEWAHATAPLARIILIEAPDTSVGGVLGGIVLANAMGPGVVSMSFAGAEGTWTSSVNSVFTVANMTYVASTGDSGAGVSWPAVSPNVLAVGGTTLTYSGTGPRSEATWLGTGGGVSGFTPAPQYQNIMVPGLGTVAHRSVADVAFNADPTTGQYVAIVSQGSSTVSWVSAGGTSLSTVQWAGLVAVANATRALAGENALGAPQTVLYNQIAAVPGDYASAFDDITAGSDGSCVTCLADVGYDQVTGLGTPNVTSLLSALSRATATPPPPVVTPAGISGNLGTALSFTVSVADSNPVTYSLSGAPSGMTIGSTGIVTWATPVAGTYSLIATAQDTRTGLSGQGLYTVAIAASQPANAAATPTPIDGKPGTAAPVIAASTMTGAVGAPLTSTISFSDPGATALSVSISGVPLGMAFSVSGPTITAHWASPTLSSLDLTLSVVDSAGSTAKATVPLTIE